MSTYLITGSNRGIGLELCRQIHKRGDNVIATCRKASKELRDLGVRIEENIEISSDESITNLCKKLSGVNLDCLIHNAGIYEFNSFDFTRNGISPEESANGLLKRIDSLNKNNSGTFWHANGEVLPW